MNPNIPNLEAATEALQKARAEYDTWLQQRENMQAKHEALKSEVPTLEQGVAQAAQAKQNAMTRFVTGDGTQDELDQARVDFNTKKQRLDEAKELLEAYRREGNLGFQERGAALGKTWQRAREIYCDAVAYDIADSAHKDRKLNASLHRAFAAWAYLHGGKYSEFLGEVFGYEVEAEKFDRYVDEFEKKYLVAAVGEAGLGPISRL